jgi:hypothetical protein
LQKHFHLLESPYVHNSHSPEKKYHRDKFVATKRNHLGILLLISCLTLGIIALVNPASLKGYFYFLLLWGVAILLFDRREAPRFLQAFIVNAFLTAIYILIQSGMYPETYGTTTPGGSQTDDSYFFSLVATSIPLGLETRPNYEEYRQGLTDILKFITPFPVYHPLDVIFFTSGIAGLICVYARRFAILLSRNFKAGQIAYVLCLFCPQLLMNGGAVLVRDTFVAALFMISLCGLIRRRYTIVVACSILQLYLRPGTAIIIAALHCFMLAPDFSIFIRKAKLSFRLAACIALAITATCCVVFVWRDYFVALLDQSKVSVSSLSRDGLNDYLDAGGKGAFSYIQRSPLILRAPLSTIFMWFMPFFHPADMLGPTGIDIRGLLLSVLLPFWLFWPHAWVFSLLITRFRHQFIGPILVFVCACFLIGMISLESRHRTIVQPLYYVLAATGYCLTNRTQKFWGYCISGTWLLIQLGYYYIL